MAKDECVGLVCCLTVLGTLFAAMFTGTSHNLGAVAVYVGCLLGSLCVLFGIAWYLHRRDSIWFVPWAFVVALFVMGLLFDMMQNYRLMCGTF